jgi:hypothetical protein
MAGVGSAVLAVPGGSAGEKPERTEVTLGATWSPNPARPGDALTLTPDAPCPLDVDSVSGEKSTAGVVFVFTDDEGGGFEIPMEEDGSWTFEATAPDEPDTYGFVAECRSSSWAEETEWCAEDEQPQDEGVTDEQFKPISYRAPAWPGGFDCEFQFYSADLTVEGDTPPTTTPPTEVPPPATPIVKPPDQTG